MNIEVIRLGGAPVPTRATILHTLGALTAGRDRLSVTLDARRPDAMRCRITVLREGESGAWFQAHAPTMHEAWESAAGKLRAALSARPSLSARLSSWLTHKSA